MTRRKNTYKTQHDDNEFICVSTIKEGVHQETLLFLANSHHQIAKAEAKFIDICELIDGNVFSSDECDKLLAGGYFEHEPSKSYVFLTWPTRSWKLEDEKIKTHT
jgi:hypothetical protein